MTSQNAAATILKQLGGNRFLMMTGSKNFLYAGITEMNPNEWLRMDLVKNQSGANRLKITLEANDTYTMYFYNGRLCKKTFDYKITKEQKFDKVYCDMLRPIFEEVTGLRTTLY